MKKLNSLLTCLLLTASLIFTQQATAQAPQKMSYQSVLRNSSNVLLTNTAVGIKISVLQGNATGTAVYEETQTATTNANGLVSLQIGLGTATTGTFAGIDWSAGPYFIKTETDPAGGTNYTITGTQEMLSVPYAMYAAKSGDAATTWSQNGNAGTVIGGSFIGTTDNVPFSIRVNNQLAAHIGYEEVESSTYLGYQAGNWYESINMNSTAIGYQALYSNTAGSNNTAIGTKALYSNLDGYSNTAIGAGALLRNTSGHSNISIGPGTLSFNTTGVYNTANGLNALFRNTTGARNVANGYFSLRNNTTGTQNVAIGESSLLTNTTGTQNTALGSEADVVTGALTNATAIGFGAKVNASNTIQLGNSSVTDVNTSGTYTAAGFKTPLGTSSQYLMADGSTSPRTTLGPVGGTSTSNGGTFTNGILSLAPADDTNSGIVTPFNQTFGGAKTFAAAPVLATATASQALFTDANKNVVSNAITGSGNVVMSVSPTLTGTPSAPTATAGNNTTQLATTAFVTSSIAASSLTVGDIGTSNAKGASVTSTVLSLSPADATNGGILTNGTQTIGGAKTFAAAPVLATATASQAVFTDANKNVVSNAITGTGNVVMSVSPTLTGTITAANQTLSGTLGVGTTTPNASAKLDVSSSTQGFLPPRMTVAQRDAIASPTQGLMLYCTNCGVNGEPQYYNGTAWVNLIGGATQLVLPKVTTNTITAINFSGATSGGSNVSTNGGANITAQGVCWSIISGNESISGSHSTDGTSSPSFTSTITGLNANTTYYVKAYVTNANGQTGYGNEVSFTTLPLPLGAIGSAEQGGIIFYILQPGDLGYVAGETHGLIAANVNLYQSFSAQNASTTLSVAQERGIGTGLANTNAIITEKGVETSLYAAGLARTYEGGGYTDWFLPSIEELRMMYLNIGQGAAVNTNIGGFANEFYWSSTEGLVSGALCIHFSDGYEKREYSFQRYYVRPCRAF